MTFSTLLKKETTIKKINLKMKAICIFLLAIILSCNDSSKTIEISGETYPCTGEIYVSENISMNFIKKDDTIGWVKFLVKEKTGMPFGSLAYLRYESTEGVSFDNPYEIAIRMEQPDFAKLSNIGLYEFSNFSLTALREERITSVKFWYNKQVIDEEYTNGDALRIAINRLFSN
jgi:hypothetical protein